MTEQRTRKKRQYSLSITTLADLSRYCLENGRKQSEVVEMAVKEYVGRSRVKAVVILAVALMSVSLSSAAGLTSVSEGQIVNAVGNVIALIAGILAPIALAIGLLMGGWKYWQGEEDAMQYIRGGIIGGVICFSAWGLAKLIMSYFGG